MDNQNSTNVCAQAVNLMEWLSGDTTFKVPAYQRNYRWDKGNCEALLEGIKEAAKNGKPYFIDSILSTGTESERTLVDGQQRLITLTLLLAALYHSANSLDKESIKKILYDPTNPETPRVRPFATWEDVLKRIIYCGSVAESDDQFGKNFNYFKQEAKENPSQIWDGLQKLTCVDILITLGDTAQQIFESLNSTGKPLRDAELINNWILMPYLAEFQGEIQRKFWIPIEENATKGNDSTGDQMDDFFRHYLSLKTGDKVEEKKGTNERNIFTTFKETFKGKLIDEDSLQAFCQEWLDLSVCYNFLLNPENKDEEWKDDEDLQESLVTLNTFGESSYPFLMAVLNDYKKNRIVRERLLKILHLIETYYFRHAVCGIDSKKISKRMASLYKELSKTSGFLRNLELKLFNDMPKDQNVEQELRTKDKGHGTDILIKLDEKKLKDEPKGGDKASWEHIFPSAASVSMDWDGGEGPCSPEEIQKMGEKINWIGNFVPLESRLNSGASDSPFQEKWYYYEQSRFDMTKELVNTIWNAEAIEKRTHDLTQRFLETWPLPKPARMEGAKNILEITEASGNAKARLNKYAGAWFRGFPLHAQDTEELFLEVWHILHKENHDMKHPRIKTEKTRGLQYKQLDDDHWLETRDVPHYQLADLKELLLEMGLADQLFVKFA